MKDEQERPNPEKILCGLKDFQRTSVEYVFQRLYKDTKLANRFLIADEVGLGKTCPVPDTNLSTYCLACT